MPREATAETHVSVQGVEVPKVGLGTWQLTGDDCVEAVRDALALGYRHVDTARAYGNEREVGRGMAEAGVARDEVFVTTKLAHTRLRAGQVREQLEGSLEELGADRVDLLLIHWPSDEVPLEETLGAMSRLRDEGMVSHLGVSNFPARLLREALELAPVIADQVEYHAYLGQPELLELARERDVMVIAYSPFARGELLREPVLAEVADAHGVTPAQVALRWLLDQPNVGAVPKAASHDKRAANLDVFSLELSEEERGRIAGLERGRRTIDPSWAPAWEAPS